MLPYVQRHKSRHEELKERARLLLEQAKQQDAMIKSMTSSSSHGQLDRGAGGGAGGTGGQQQAEAVTSPSRSTASSECSPVSTDDGVICCFQKVTGWNIFYIIGSNTWC